MGIAYISYSAHILFEYKLVLGKKKKIGGLNIYKYFIHQVSSQKDHLGFDSISNGPLVLSI